MSQYQSFMFSDAVYLFATLFSRYGKQAELYGNLEELPDGTWDQEKLAKRLVLAAFACLYQKQLIAIDLGKRKSWFRKQKTATVIKLQSSASGLSGVELDIFSSLRDKSDMYHLTQALIERIWVSSNPWRRVLKIVKKNLLDRGIVKRVVKEKILFIRTHKYKYNGDSSRDIAQAAKQLTELQKTLKEFQSNGELYQQMLSDIEEGIASNGFQEVAD
jgi:hypothetical protein